MEEKNFLEELKRAVLKHEANAKVILYGSRARGDGKEDSDWDLLVLTNKKLDVKTEGRIHDSIYELELKYLQPVSTLIMDDKHWQKISITGFYENVNKDGVAI